MSEAEAVICVYTCIYYAFVGQYTMLYLCILPKTLPTHTGPFMVGTLDCVMSL